MRKIFFLELLLTRKCNQSCYYCSYWKNSNEYKIEIDLDLVKWIINEYSKYLINIPFYISLSGGEPALISNLVELVELLKQNDKVNFVTLNSNGLVRLKYPNLINEVDRYFEHLVLDIKDKEIQKFYDLEFLRQSNSINVIVVTKNVLQSLIDNFDWFKENDMINYYFWYKPLNKKNNENDVYKLKFLAFLKGMTYYSKFYDYNMNIKDNLKCFKNPHTPVIDLQKKQIIHCSVNYENGLKASLTSENIYLQMKHKLFTKIPSYCLSCNVPTHIDNSNKIYNRVIP